MWATRCLTSADLCLRFLAAISLFLLTTGVMIMPQENDIAARATHLERQRDTDLAARAAELDASYREQLRQAQAQLAAQVQGLVV